MKSLYILVVSILFSIVGQAQVISENFNTGIPQGWLTYSEYSFDYVTANGGQIDLFKQSEGNEPLMLATPAWDYSQYTKLEVDVYGINLSFLSTTVPRFLIGYLETEGDFSSFKGIQSLEIRNTSYETIEIFLGAFKANTNLVFRMEGDKAQIVYLDNFNLFDEPYESGIPNAVENLQVRAEPTGENTMIVSWTNPTLQVDGNALTELLYVELLANGTLSETTVDPAIGENEVYNLTVPTAGFYKLKVTTGNSVGDGYSVFSDEIWVGLDVPGAVSGLNIIKDGTTVNLDWSAPTDGANGSFFDGVIDSYKIIRSDGKEFIVPGNDNKFTDILDIQGSINYTVIPINKSGEGTAAISPIIYHLNGDYIFFEDFYVDVVERPDETLDYSHKWTNEGSINRGFWNHFFSTSAGTNAGEMAYLWGNQSSGNDVARVISPVISTVGLPAIAIEYNQSIDFPNNPNFEIALETTSDGGQNWTTVDTWKANGNITEAVKKVIGNQDIGSDNFQFSISVKGNTSYANYARIDNIRVYYQPNIDLVTSQIIAPDLVEPGTMIDLVGFIENGSTELVDGQFVLEVRDRFTGDIIEFYTLGLTDIGIGEEVELLFGTWEAKEGEYELVLTAINEDDVVQDNNFLIRNIDVLQLVDKDNVLVEEFTGTWCSACPGAALGIADLIAEGQALSAVAYHRNDDYETDVTQTKMDLYQILGFPTVVFDGEISVIGGDFNTSVVGNYRQPMADLISRRVPVNLEFINPYIEANQYHVSIAVNSLSQIKNPNYKLRIAITEDEIEEEWQSLNELEFVQRTYDEMPLNLENRQDIVDVVINAPPEVVKNHSKMIAWVQSEDNNQVYNTIELNLGDVLLSSDELSAAKVEIYPNPTTSHINVKGYQDYEISIYTNTGEKVNAFSSRPENQFNLENLKAGSYIIELINKSSNERILQKIIKL